MRAYKNPIPKYPKFQRSQGALEVFEPIPANKNKNASKSAQKTTQKNFNGQLVKCSLEAAKAKIKEVVIINPANCQGQLSIKNEVKKPNNNAIPKMDRPNPYETIYCSCPVQRGSLKLAV